MLPTPQLHPLHLLFSVARVGGTPCHPDWSTPPSIWNSCDQLACSTLVSLPPAPRSKLVRSVRSRPSVLTSPWLKKQLWTSTTALTRFGSRVSEHGALGIGVGSSPLSMLLSCCALKKIGSAAGGERVGT